MKKSHTARGAAGVVALLLSFAVAGCDEDDPSGSPPPSSTLSSPDSSSPTEATSAATPTGPVEPTLPTEAERADKAGAEAFVSYYYDVVNYATATGDVAQLKTLDEPSCGGCQNGIELIEKVYGRGGRIVGGDYRVLKLESLQLHGDVWSVTARTHVNDQFVRGAGDLNQKYPGGRSGLHFTLHFQEGAWKTTTLEGL
jgi:hypothetical protein